MELFVPVEIISDILSRVPVVTIMQCKCVSKSWRALINDPTFVDNYRLEHEEEGFLFYTTNHHSGNQIFHYGEYNYKDTSFKLCELTNHHDLTNEIIVVGSCKGLICLRSSTTSSICVYNPFTGEYMNLQQLKGINRWVVSGFGYHPITKQYKVVVICFNRFKSSEHVVYVHTLGSNRWRCKGKTRCCSLRFSEPRVTYVDGALYWMNIMTEIVMFDLATEELQTVPSPPQQSNYSYSGQELGVLGGSLCMFGPNYRCHSSYIYVMNSKDYSWRKTSSIQWKGPSKLKPVALSIHGNIWLDCGSDQKGTVEFYDVKTKVLRFIKIFNKDRGWPEEHTEIIPFTKSFVSLKVLFAEEDEREKEKKHIMVPAASMHHIFQPGHIPLEKLDH